MGIRKQSYNENSKTYSQTHKKSKLKSYWHLKLDNSLLPMPSNASISCRRDVTLRKAFAVHRRMKVNAVSIFVIITCILASRASSTKTTGKKKKNHQKLFPALSWNTASKDWGFMYILEVVRTTAPSAVRKEELTLWTSEKSELNCLSDSQNWIDMKIMENIEKYENYGKGTVRGCHIAVLFIISLNTCGFPDYNICWRTVPE